VQASWSPATELWLAPLKALVQTEKAPAVVYEGTIVMPVFSLELLPDAVKSLELEFQIVEEKAAQNR
jgi:hypothetical protein